MRARLLDSPGSGAGIVTVTSGMSIYQTSGAVARSRYLPPLDTQIFESEVAEHVPESRDALDSRTQRRQQGLGTKAVEDK